MRPAGDDGVLKRTFGIAQVRSGLHTGRVQGGWPGLTRRWHNHTQVEVWGLGGKRAEEYQRSQRQWEDRQVERVRAPLPRRVRHGSSPARIPFLNQAKAGPRSEWGVERMLLEMLGRTTHLDDQRLAGMRAPIDEDDDDV